MGEVMVDDAQARKEMLGLGVHRHIREACRARGKLRRTWFCSSTACGVEPLDTIYETVSIGNNPGESRREGRRDSPG